MPRLVAFSVSGVKYGSPTCDFETSLWPLILRVNRFAGASSGNRNGAVSGEPCDLRDDVCAGRGRAFSRCAADRCDKGRSGRAGGSCRRRPGGYKAVAPVRRVPGCLHGRRRRGACVDGILHAQRPARRIGIALCGFERWAVAHAFDPLCREPRDQRAKCRFKIYDTCTSS